MARFDPVLIASFCISCVAYILFGVGFSTTYYITAQSKNTEHNTTNCQDDHNGFWKVCVKQCNGTDYDCYHIRTTATSPGLVYTAWVCAALGLICILMALCLSQKRLRVFTGLASVGNLFAAVLGIAAGTYFVVKSKDGAKGHPHFTADISLGWSFYLHIVGCVIFLVASGVNAFACCCSQSKQQNDHSRIQ